MAIKAANRKKLAKRLLSILDKDRDERLLRIDQYVRGIQDDPYMPDNADTEYRLLAQRAITNVMGFIIDTPAQAMYVDQFRRGHAKTDTDSTEGGKPLDVRASKNAPEWDHWQRSRMDARQGPVYRGALTYGHSFVLTEKVTKAGRDKGKVRSKGLSALRTVAVYEDAANDDAPIAALHVTSFPGSDADKDPGTARMWDDSHEYEVTFKSFTDVDGITVKQLAKHGATECPVTRFTAAIDLEGRTCGVVEPMIPLQNRINQTVFDLLIVQSFASFKVRTISGMAPPLKMKPVDEDGETITREQLAAGAEPAGWVPELDANGRPIPEVVNLNAKRVFWAEDENTKFSTLDETPLDGFISAIELAFRHIAALSQTPPHHLLGQIANLSAEALTAAETALSRKVDEFKASFGESWERVFRIAAEIGNFDGAEDFHGETIWRDMESRSLAQAGDALSKLHNDLGIPKKGLWKRVPNVTSNELEEWEALAEEEQDGSAAATVAAIRRQSTVTAPTFREPVDQVGTVAA